MTRKIITAVEIENFRSLKNPGPLEMESSNALFGLNSSGKSNLLRALNWFFNDLVEDGQPISLASDINYSKQKKKKEISIKVTFDPSAVNSLPESLKNRWYPKKIFSIVKTVRYKNNLQENVFSFEYGENPSPLGNFEINPWVTSFISLFRFRYIPAYRNPTNLIKDLMSEAQRYLEPSIKQRLTFSKNRATNAIGQSAKNINLFEQMQYSVQQAAIKIFEELESRVKKNLSNVSKLQAGLPENWLTWVKDLGFRFTTHAGGIVDEQAQGAGAQSYLFLLLLCFIAKRTRSYGFGWRQGEIWGIEEPEIYMHYSLAEQCARLLREVSDSQAKNDAPIQLFITTHSYPFIAAMKKKIPVEISSGGYTVFSSEQKVDIGPVIAGVLPYTHPLFSDVGKRLLIIEGTQDRDILEKYLQCSPGASNYKVVRISDLIHASQGDNSDKQMVDYIKKNCGPLVIRAALGGIMILLDSTINESQARSIIKSLHNSFDSFKIQGDKKNLIKVICLNKCTANPELDETFTGIERFLPTNFVKEVCSQNNIELAQSKINGDLMYTLPPRHKAAFNRQAKRIIIDKFCTKKAPTEKDMQFLNNIFVQSQEKKID